MSSDQSRARPLCGKTDLGGRADLPVGTTIDRNNLNILGLRQHNFPQNSKC